mgnify:FL=1|tara:strand:+ start:1062 stop:1553 length:492 start_codon:yes stop_codon:yes gene_type:complete
MSNLSKINSKILSLENLNTQVNSWKTNGLKVVFTNGCFDLLHRGHIEVLSKAADLGDRLIVGMNSDTSIVKLKGEKRPVLDESSRSTIIASLSFVDAVVVFTEETPLNLIINLKPDILAKGGDYETSSIVGHDFIQKYGGEVILIPFIDGFSSTKIINNIKKS